MEFLKFLLYKDNNDDFINDSMRNFKSFNQALEDIKTQHVIGKKDKPEKLPHVRTNLLTIMDNLFTSRDMENFKAKDLEVLAFSVTKYTKKGVQKHRRKRSKLMPLEDWGLNLFLGDGDGLKFYSM
jgi:hypothetical protein